MIMFPQYGAWVAGRELIEMAASLEELGKQTADGFEKAYAEMAALRTMTMQNRIALDMILAAEGGTCAVIGKECCTYIPDNSEKIQDVVQHVRKGASKYHDYIKAGSFDPS